VPLICSRTAATAAVAFTASTFTTWRADTNFHTTKALPATTPRAANMPTTDCSRVSRAASSSLNTTASMATRLTNTVPTDAQNSVVAHPGLTGDGSTAGSCGSEVDGVAAICRSASLV
jgi:hypothetical protein